MGTGEKPAATGPISHPASFSPTAMRAWATCPRQYELGWARKVACQEEASPHLIFGNALHQALAFLYRLEVGKRDLEVAQRAFRHFWARQDRRDEAFLSRDEEANWGMDGLQALETFFAARPEEVKLEPAAVEEWVRASLETGFSVAGKVDRVDKVRVPTQAAEDGFLDGLSITDYKSGKAKLQNSDDVAEDRGAQVYALAAARTFRRPVLEVRYLYLRENKVATWKLEPDDLGAIEEQLARRVDEIVADQTFEARPDFHCRWCRFRSICPEGSGQVQPEQLDQTPSTAF